jgi:flagellar motor switch protein FliN
MSQFDEVLASPEWAFTLAGALEQQLGDDRILTVGSVRENASEVLGEEPTRAFTLRFTTPDGQQGTVALIAGATFADALERSASDETMLGSCAGALEAAARAIGEQAVVDVDTESAVETETELVLDETGDAARVMYPVLDGGNPVGSLLLRISTGAVHEVPVPVEDHTPASTGAEVAAQSGASYVLADVEMGVTAELGRCRMTVRELLSITPGAVIDLDRAAGSPVDVLVNGTLIARGEVVVIDEEFGIRISELVPQPAGAR